MTNVTIIGGVTPIQKKKPIQFVKTLGTKGICNALSVPHMWDNIELICNNYGDGYDLMFAYNSNREDGIAYLGYFNDGIVYEEVTND